jgi:hypothetical protein
MFSLIVPMALTTQAPPAKVDRNKKVRDNVAKTQQVINARRARQAAKNRQWAKRDLAADKEYQRQQAEYEKAVAAQREFEIRMEPVWAAEHANQIQQQRNALIAQANAIEKYKADYLIRLMMDQRR